jgi:Tfp pilus assembly protein PilV
MQFNKYNQQGQGLLETIVALGIIVSGLVGMMNLTISNQTAGEDAEERLIATNLAREGIEVVRAIRDTNWLTCEVVAGVLNCSAWDKDLVSGTDTTAVPLFNVTNNTWAIDFTPNDIAHNYARIWRKSAGTAANIGTQFQSTEATPTDSVLTAYSRLLELHLICTDKTIATSCAGGNPKIGIRVQSKVQWEARGKENDIIVEERLFNWR